MEKELFTSSRKRTLISTKATQPTCKIHALSNLDVIMEKHHLKIIYYYNTPNVGLPLGEMTAKIRENLAELLSYYPVLVGRLVRNEKGRWMVRCNDAGLRLIAARVKGSLVNWLTNVDDVKENMLVHWEDMFDDPYLWSTTYVKVTEFEGGGFALGLSCSHMISDPISATMLIKALSETILHGKISIPPLFHPLPQNRLGFNPFQNKPNTYLNNKSPSPSPSPSPFVAEIYRTITLEFKDHEIQSCIGSAQLNGPINNDGPSLGFVALVGLLWNCISRNKGVTHKLVDTSICLDMRKILGLDKGFFGNCMMSNNVRGDGIRVGDIVSSTKAINDVITNGNKEEIMDRITSFEHCDDDNNLTFINLENVDPYSTMFIDGYEPIRVSYYSESTGGKEKVLILPPRPGEGQSSRIVMVTLPKDEALKLCEDECLMRYSPVIIMS